MIFCVMHMLHTTQITHNLEKDLQQKISVHFWISVADHSSGLRTLYMNRIYVYIRMTV